MPALVTEGVTAPLSHLLNSRCTAEHHRECHCSLKMETKSFHMPGMCSRFWNPIKVCTSKSACVSRGMPDTFSNDEKIPFQQKHFNIFLKHMLWINIIYLTCKFMKVYHRQVLYFNISSELNAALITSTLLVPREIYQILLLSKIFKTWLIQFSFHSLLPF